MKTKLALFALTALSLAGLLTSILAVTIQFARAHETGYWMLAGFISLGGTVGFGCGFYRCFREKKKESECTHPWSDIVGDGEMSPAKCLKCGKYL